VAPYKVLLSTDSAELLRAPYRRRSKNLPSDDSKVLQLELSAGHHPKDSQGDFPASYFPCGRTIQSSGTLSASCRRPLEDSPVAHLALFCGGGRRSIEEMALSISTTMRAKSGRLCVAAARRQRVQYDEESFRHGTIRPFAPP
jgi:hypothetical protein